jgi:DNA-binding transcriptional ArsR family regulator
MVFIIIILNIHKILNNNRGVSLKKRIVIQRVEQLKAISNPLRMQIIEALSCKPMTTKQVAAVLGKQPTRLYHHVNILKKAGLITLIRTVKKRGTTEKYFQTAAHEFTVNRGLLRSGQRIPSSLNDMQGMIASQLRRTVQEVLESIELKGKGRLSEGQPLILSSSRIQTTPDRIKSLNTEIHAVLKKYEIAPPGKDANEYKFTLVLYPVLSKAKGKKTGVH